MTSHWDGLQIVLDRASPAGRWLERARAAYDNDAPSTMDTAYQSAGKAATEAGRPDHVIALAVGHVRSLLELHQAQRALKRAETYLRRFPDDHYLLLVHAQAASELGCHQAAAAGAERVRTAPGLSLGHLDRAFLARIEAFAAAAEGRADVAETRLAEAGRHFAAADRPDAVAAVDADRRQIALWRGDAGEFDEELNGSPPTTGGGYLRRVLACRFEQRYEQAVALCRQGLADARVEEAMHLQLRVELVVVLRLMHRDDEAAEQLVLLPHDAAHAPPEVAEPLLHRVARLPGSGDFFDRVRWARTLIAMTHLLDPDPGRTTDPDAHLHLAECETELARLRDQWPDNRGRLSWLLAAGEWEFASHRSTPSDPDRLARAIDHCGEVVRGAGTRPLAELKAAALNRLGHALHESGEADGGLLCWHEADRLRVHIAAQQDTDDGRRHMLMVRPTERDERIKAAVTRLRAGPAKPEEPEWAAAVVVALEAARGPTILNAIEPGIKDLARDLPAPPDLAGAQRWLSEKTHSLHRSQAVWMMHAAAEEVHHAIVHRDGVAYASAPARALDVEDAVDALMALCDPRTIDKSIDDRAFEPALAAIGDLIGVAAIVARIPRKIERIAIVAGGSLGDIPFAGLPIPGEEPVRRMGQRYALSDLPCLSVLRPLRKRSSELRGDRALLVSPPDDKLTAAENLVRYRKARNLLDGDKATPNELRARLATHEHRQVRIDSHGEHVHGDAMWSYLALVPDSPAGRVTAKDLAELDLSGCGTVVLGACESGMAERVGQDEPVGFVRSALAAGAASVLAARWVAADSAAARVLDAFDRYVSHLPRDRALQRAQLDELEKGTPLAHWACWTLYGDAGSRTRAGPARRLVRRLWQHLFETWRKRRNANTSHARQADGVRLVRRSRPPAGQRVP